MSFLYLTGANLNTFGRGTVSISPTAASVSAAANVYDGDPGCPLLFGSVAAGYVKVDCNALTNPGFETSTLSGWTSADSGPGPGVSSQTTTAGEFRSGSKGLKLSCSSTANQAGRYQTITVRAGEYRKATFYIKGDTNANVSLMVQNQTTGNYYNGSAWVSSFAAAVTQAATGSFVAVNLTYQVESYASAGSDSMSLKWQVYMVPASSSANAYVDDCSDVPGVSFASVHGHNLIADPTVESSDDDSAWTTRATMTRKRPAFWTSFDIVYARYWKLAWSTALTAPYIGEAVLGQYETSATPCLAGPITSYDLPGARDFSSLGRASAYTYCTDPRESVRLEFSADTEAAARELLYSLFIRSKQGQLPVIVVPLSTETSVYFGRLANPMEQRRPFLNIYDVGFDLIGDPFPTVGL